MASPDPLRDLLLYVGGFPSIPEEVSSQLRQALDTFSDQSGLDQGIWCGIVGKDGPLSWIGELDTAMMRLLVGQVHSSMPPLTTTSIDQHNTRMHDGRSSLGFGLRRKKGDERTASWSSFGSVAIGWVPGLGGSSVPPHTSKSPNGSPSSIRSVNREREAESQKRKVGGWTSLGLGSLGGLGDAVGLGSVGSVLGFSAKSGVPEKTKEPVAPEDSLIATPDLVISHPTQSSETSGLEEREFNGHDQPENSDKEVVQTSVEQSETVLSELEDAVEMPHEEIAWEGRWVWVKGPGGVKSLDAWIKRRLNWVIVCVFLPQWLSLINLYFLARQYSALYSGSRIRTSAIHRFPT